MALIKGIETYKADFEICPFCRRKLRVAKIQSHACTKKTYGRKQWREYIKVTDTAKQYPTLASFVAGILDGSVHYPEFIIQPNDIHPSEQVDTDVSSPADTPLPQHQASTEPTDNSGDAIIINDIIPSTPDEDRSSVLESDPNRVQNVQKAVQKMTGAVIEAKQQLREKGAGMKERAWYPIIQGIHHLIMFAGKAKDRGSGFKLDKDQKRFLAAGYQCTFGDSPLLKMKKFSIGDDTIPDVLTANLEIYGEWVVENAEGFWDRGKGIVTRLKNRRKKNENDIPPQPN